MSVNGKEETDLSQLNAVGIANLLNTEGTWGDVLKRKLWWKNDNPDRRHGPDICTTALLNPQACDQNRIDWNQLRPMLAKGSNNSYFGFCQACVKKIEEAGHRFLSGSLREAVQGAQERRWSGGPEIGQLAAAGSPDDRMKIMGESPLARSAPQLIGPPPALVASPAPSPAEPAEAPEMREEIPSVETYMAMTEEELKGVQEKLEAVLSAIKDARKLLGEQECARQKASCDEALRRIAEARQRAAEKQRQEARDSIANLMAAAGIRTVYADGAKVEVASPPMVERRAPHTEPPVSVARIKGSKHIACNVSEMVNGDPDERLGFISKFDPEDYDTADKCFDALAQTSERYWDLLRMHADQQATDSELRQHDSPARKDAKNLAKRCPLHGPECKGLGYFRYCVIKHIRGQWPDQWRERKTGAGENGFGPDAPSLKCSECAAKVRKLFGDPPLWCGTCHKRRRNKERRLATARADNERRQSKDKNDGGKRKKKVDGGKKGGLSKDNRQAAKRAARGY